MTTAKTEPSLSARIEHLCATTLDGMTIDGYTLSWDPHSAALSVWRGDPIDYVGICVTPDIINDDVSTIVVEVDCVGTVVSLAYERVDWSRSDQSNVMIWVEVFRKHVAAIERVIEIHKASEGRDDLHARFQAHGFTLGRTGGHCLAYIRVLPDASEIWINTVDSGGGNTGDAPIHLAERIIVGRLACRDGEVEEDPSIWSITTSFDYLALLDAAEVVLGPVVLPLRDLIVRELDRAMNDDDDVYGSSDEACTASAEIAERMKLELGYDWEQDKAVVGYYAKATAVEIFEDTLKRFDRISSSKT